MGKWREKNVYVQACQFCGWEETPIIPGMFVDGNTMDNSNYYCINMDGIKIKLNVSDWVVQKGKDTFFVLSDKDFREKYIPCYEWE